MNQLRSTAVCLSVLSLAGVASAAQVTPEPEPAQRTIELAICLDTSGSMSGLIESAKQKLWSIVNELALAEPTPRLRVALLTYGNDGHSAENGWVRVDSPFTDDLDAISQQLFALSTNGGTEFVGRVLHYSGQLDWSPSDDTLKLAIVAGNEGADQDQEMPFPEVCRALISRGIMVNAIYCGPAADAIAPGWREVAKLADGQFASIDQNTGTVVIATPFDDQLSALSVSVNETYIPFGATGQQGWLNQTAQDANAQSLNGAAAAARAQTKAQGLYNCSWDLVDACRTKQVNLAEVPDDQLPEPMQGMNADERQAYVDDMLARRTAIQDEINEMSRKRDAFVRTEMASKGLDEAKSFDGVIRKAIRAQAVAKGFGFKAPAEALEEADGERESTES